MAKHIGYYNDPEDIKDLLDDSGEAVIRYYLEQAAFRTGQRRLVLVRPAPGKESEPHELALGAL